MEAEINPDHSNKESPTSSCSPSSYSSLSPFSFPNIVEEICSYLPLTDLKTTRLLNHVWLKASQPSWSKKTQITFKNIDSLRVLLAKSLTLRKVLPFTITNWVFQGETLPKLYFEDQIHELDNLAPFWSSIKSLTYSDWMKKIMVWEFYIRRTVFFGLIDIWDIRLVPAYIPTRMASAYGVTKMLSMCTNLTQMVIHYPLLINLRGAYIRGNQFPKLEKLSSLEIYYEGEKWSPTAAGNGEDLFWANLVRANDAQTLPRQTRAGKSGGNTLILRILEHSPNLVSVTVTSGTLIATRVESWFMLHLLNETVKLPKLKRLHCSIPLLESLCPQLQIRPWRLGALHLRIGPNNLVPARALCEMLISFSDSLKHLELIYFWNGEPQGQDHTLEFEIGKRLIYLESLEMWGFRGSFQFLRDFQQLQRLVIGATDAEGFEPLKEYFEKVPMPHLNLELKTSEDFILRLDQGLQNPIKIK